MNVRELIAKLEQYDGGLEVVITTSSGNEMEIGEVEPTVFRDNFDGDWDRRGVRICAS